VNGDFDPRDLEAHAAFAAENPAARAARREKRQRVLVDEIRKLAKYELRMRAAFNKWNNQRARVTALENRLDKEFGQ
jgi:hypothetical protein